MTHMRLRPLLIGVAYARLRPRERHNSRAAPVIFRCLQSCNFSTNPRHVYASMDSDRISIGSRQPSYANVSCSRSRKTLLHMIHTAAHRIFGRENSPSSASRTNICSASDSPLSPCSKTWSERVQSQQPTASGKVYTYLVHASRDADAALGLRYPLTSPQSRHTIY